MKQINCKEIADNILSKLEHEVQLTEPLRDVRCPKLIILTVGEDPASKVYVNNKIKVGEKLGIKVEHIQIDEHLDVIVDYMTDLKKDKTVDGIILQLPLPPHLQQYQQKLIDLIPPQLDVDGLTTWNQGAFMVGSEPYHKPCTPSGVLEVFEKEFGISLRGKSVAIVGRCILVGQPLAKMLQDLGATVTVFHNQSNNSFKLKLHKFDAVVLTIGKANFWTNKYRLRYGKKLIVIDLGINRNDEGELVGNFNTKNSLKNVDILYTPVPNGVDLLTVAKLFENTTNAWRYNNGL